MLRSTFLLALVVFGFALQAQERGTRDIVSISGRYALPQEYKEIYDGTATEIGMLNALTAGFKLAPKTMFAINVNHFYFNVQDEAEMPADVASPIIINGIILRIGIIQELKSGGKLQLFFAPRLMSDFQNLDGNSFQFGALASYQNDINEDLSLGFGAMYNQELFGPYMVPLFLLDWQASDRWYIEGMVPVTLKVHYRINEGLDVGFNHFGLITSYYLGHEDYAGDYMERQSIDLSLFARQRLYGNFFIEGMIGRTFGRSYTQYSGDETISFGLPLISFGDERTANNVTFNDGMIFTLKLIFNMKVPD
ncbi:MAG: DUF6268 family outer membrane beta-barrel protein [Bacteroidota bacterium]|nr:DUF6268 family outer membrane beta-barrel protein [Bacteroidota bacterium]